LVLIEGGLDEIGDTTYTAMEEMCRNIEDQYREVLTKGLAGP